MLNLVNIIKVNKFQLLISLIRILISLTLVHHNINIHPQINQFNKIWDINLKHLLFSSHLKDYIIHHLVTQLPPYTCKINSTVVRTSAEDLHLITSPLLQGVKNQSERWPL